MATSADLCQICRECKFIYTCPKCNISYCSVICYKAPQHLKCSEEFYKDCIHEELAVSNEIGSNGDIKRIYEILKRIHEADSGFEALDDFDDGLNDELDSDDESDAEDVSDGQDEDNKDLPQRLRGIDIDDTDKVWQRLTASEKQDFQQLVDSGDIIKLLPEYRPWWLKQQTSKIVDISAQRADVPDNKPKLAKNIPKFADICKKEPSSCLHYNLWNVLAAYACTTRFFGGEHLKSSWEAATYFIDLSATLKYSTNFEDVEDALVSVQMEGVSSVDPEELQRDTRQLMLSHEYKLLALSDILQLLKLAKQYVKETKREDAEFQKLYAMCSGRKKLHELIKKIEFMLSFVMREGEESK